MRFSLALLAPILFVASASQAQSPVDKLSDSDLFKHPIESFSLRHAHVEHVVRILNDQFMHTINFSADSTTNTIYGRMPKELKLEVEAFLARLEGAAEQQAQQRVSQNSPYQVYGGRPAIKNESELGASRAASEVGDPPATKNELTSGASSAAYEAAERQAAKLADRWQREKQRGKLSDDAMKKLRQSVSEQVSSAFHLRQKLKRDELARAQQQLDAIQKRLDLRREMSDKIIQRRVDELLSDTDLNWLTSQDRAENELRTSDLDLPVGLASGVQIEALDEGILVLRGKKPDVEMVAKSLSVATGGDPTSPRVRGEVMNRNDEKKTLLLSIGSNNGLKVGTLLNVTRKGQPIGRVQVVSVAPKDAIARIVSQNAETGIDKGDQVHVISENTEPTKIEAKSESK